MPTHRHDNAQPASPLSQSTVPKTVPSRPKRPSRGKVLCVFSCKDRMAEIEPQVSKRGYSLLRARPGIHAYWLAITSRPDAILTDMTDPGPDSDSAYLMDCLHRNKKTNDIPVVAILESTIQEIPAQSGLGHAKLCVRADAEVDFVLERMDGLIDNARDANRTKFRRADSGHASQIDAVFSEIGSGDHSKIDPPMPLLGPIRMPTMNSSLMNS